MIVAALSSVIFKMSYASTMILRKFVILQRCVHKAKNRNPKADWAVDHVPFCISNLDYDCSRDIAEVENLIQEPVSKECGIDKV